MSVDNVLVLALMVSALPPEKRGQALKYGMWGAFIFRAIAVLLAVWLIKWWWIKIIGGSLILEKFMGTFASLTTFFNYVYYY